MSILYRFGSRLYEFNSQEDLSKAYSIYIRLFDGLDEFEENMEEAGVNFNYEESEIY